MGDANRLWPTPIRGLVSGGQTGADRAGLDWALANGVPCAGWCPKGRGAEDGRIDDRYPLQEATTFRYIQRTDWNVRDSEATVLFTIAPELTEGTLATANRAKKHGRPCLHLSRETLDGDAGEAARLLREFIARHQPKSLNIAGPRASKEPEVGAWVIAVLDAAFPDRASDAATTPAEPRDTA